MQQVHNIIIICKVKGLIEKKLKLVMKSINLKISLMKGLWGMRGDGYKNCSESSVS
jgi:hypothetical protein